MGTILFELHFIFNLFNNNDVYYFNEVTHLIFVKTFKYERSINKLVQVQRSRYEVDNYNQTREGTRA